jgi:hypothetical protein
MIKPHVPVLPGFDLKKLIYFNPFQKFQHQSRHHSLQMIKGGSSSAGSFAYINYTASFFLLKPVSVF